VIERELTRAGVEAEVVCFGMDGAPTSMKSYRFLKTRYASSFLKIGFDQAGQPFEIEPTDFTPGSADRLRAFNTFRYLYYKTNAYLRFKRLSAAIGGAGRRVCAGVHLFGG
jgi:hypothetical protein